MSFLLRRSMPSQLSGARLLGLPEAFGERKRAMGSFHRRPLKIKPAAPPQDEVPSFHARSHLRDMELGRKQAKKLMREEHGHLDDLIGDEEVELPSSPRGSGSYESVLRQSGLPRLKRIDAWEKKELTRAKEIFSSAAGRSDGLIVMENKRLVNEAIALGIKPMFVATSRISLLAQLHLTEVVNKDSIEIMLVPYRDICSWSDLVTSPGFLCVFSKDEMEEVATRKKESALPLTLILDNIRNPDNFGAVLRVAAAAGCRNVVAMTGCTEAWRPKVLRAAAGAHFRVPVRAKVEWPEVHRFVGPSPRVYVANMDSSGKVSVAGEVYGERTSVPDLLRECRGHVCIDPSTDLTADSSYEDEDLLDRFSNVTLESVPYSSVDCSDCGHGEVVVVIGGETEGLSRCAHKFAVQNEGREVHVPLLNGMESLNVLSVASVLLFQVQNGLLSFRGG